MQSSIVTFTPFGSRSSRIDTPVGSTSSPWISPKTKPTKMPCF